MEPADRVGVILEQANRVCVTKREHGSLGP